MSELTEKLQLLKKATPILANASLPLRDATLAELSSLLLKKKSEILRANEKDLLEATRSASSTAFIDRLRLTEDRLLDMINSIQTVITSKDPLGQVLNSFTAAKNIHIEQVSVPLGVIGVVYEGRPNVTIDAAALCLKSGNVVLLRGSRTALNTNFQLIEILKSALKNVGLPINCVEGLFDTSGEVVDQMLSATGYLDVIIPRGGKEFINYVRNTARVPIIETGAGNCHIFVAADADLNMATNIVINGKTSRPSVCNATETLLIERGWGDFKIIKVLEELKNHRVEIRGCALTQALVPQIKHVTEQDYAEEFLDLIIAVRIVDSLQEALSHIARYGSKHSEAIITNSAATAEQFLNMVDAACVYHNCSTRFSDGGEFGFGAEIGISTQKLHARGPLGLKELTSYKYKVRGVGQVR